jgi:hypothetical protein
MRIISLVALTLLVAGPIRAIEKTLKDPEGATLGVVLDCSSCKGSADPAKCDLGTDAGFHGDAPCGQCLLDANFGAGYSSQYDVRITGRLIDLEGKPIKDKFVQVRLANTWGVKGRTSDKGEFMLRLGATKKRKTSTPAALELGDIKTKQDSKVPVYMLYLLPQGYKPCKAKEEQKD